MKIIRLANVVRINNLIKSIKLVEKREKTVLMKGKTPSEVAIEVKKWAEKFNISIKDIETVTF